MIQRTGENLVFLLSAPRAGSTLLSAILARHSQVLCPNEPWFLLGLFALHTGGNRTQSPYDQVVFDSALQDFFSESEFIDAARAFALQAYNGKLQRHGRSVFVDKTPRYYHVLEQIDRLFPQAKKIWLQRNPLDVVASYLTSWQLAPDQLFDPTDGPHSLDLTVGLARFARFFRGQSQTLEIHYEDLVRTPAEVIARLCRFLEIPCEPGLENYGADARHLEQRKGGRMGDRKLFEHARPHADSLDRWKTVLTDAQIQKTLETIGRRCFERMGYFETLAELDQRGFQFADERAVEKTLETFEAAARSLPWVLRDRESGRPITAGAGDENPRGFTELWKRVWRSVIKP